MGWGSGTSIFDDMVHIIINCSFNDNTKKHLIRHLILALENNDWDCHGDSEYWDDPIVQEVMNDLHPDFFEE